MSETELTITELVDRALELEETGHKREALEYWRAVSKRKPDSSILCQYGDLAADLGEWTEAEDAYMSAMRLEPEWAGPYEALGQLYMGDHDKRDLDLAQKYLKKCLVIEKTTHAYTLLGVVQKRLGMIIEARENYNEALKIDPNYEEAYYNLGVTYREENPTKAIALFRKALEIDPDFQAAYRELGWTLKRLKQFREAKINLIKSIEMNDEDGWAHIYLGNLLWATRNFALAEDHYKKAIDIWPDDSVPYWCLAHFYEYQGRASEADFFYEKALELNPDDPQANRRFGFFLMEIGDTVKAKVYLERALSLDPDDWDVRSALAELD